MCRFRQVIGQRVSVQPLVALRVNMDKARYVAVAYPIGDLLVRGPAVLEVSIGDHTEKQPASGGLHVSTVKPDFPWLTGLIFEKVAPDTWLNKGGKGTITRHNEAYFP